MEKCVDLLNLQDIHNYNIKKRGKFLFLFGSKLDKDYLYNFEKILNNYKFIIFSNQIVYKIVKENAKNKAIYQKHELEVVFSGIKDFDIFDELCNFGNKLQHMENLFNTKLSKVEKVNSFAIKYINFKSAKIKYNYLSVDKKCCFSFIINNKYIFPIFANVYIPGVYYNIEYLLSSDSYLSDHIFKEILDLIWPQILDLINSADIPEWGINYSKEALGLTTQISENLKVINDLNSKNENLEQSIKYILNSNSYLWQKNSNLEQIFKTTVKKLFPNWNEQVIVDQEDALYKDEKNNIYIFEIKGTSNFINEKYVTQLAKFIPDIEERYSNCNIYPILFINSQNHIDPKERKFDYNPEIIKRLKRFKISVITSTRFYNLISKKNMEQLIEEFKSYGIHDEKIEI